jgi:hypothetical protein
MISAEVTPPDGLAPVADRYESMIADSFREVESSLQDVIALERRLYFSRRDLFSFIANYALVMPVPNTTPGYFDPLIHHIYWSPMNLNVNRLAEAIGVQPSDVPSIAGPIEVRTFCGRCESQCSILASSREQRRAILSGDDKKECICNECVARDQERQRRLIELREMSYREYL